MNEFIKHYDLVISTLSPVHIGCGEDYEPTSYIIEDNLLHAFDPSHAAHALSRPLYKKLIDLAEQPNIERIKTFFHENRAEFIPYTKHLVTVQPAVAKTYTDTMIKADRNNKLELERTFYNPHTYSPILPGSSIKGAVRTAILNAINAGKAKLRDEKYKDLQKRLLGGGFASDPLRLIKLGDAACQEANGITEIRYCVSRYRKRKQMKPGQPVNDSSGMDHMVETILPSYRRFQGSLNLQLLPENIRGDVPAIDKRTTALAAIAQVCNAFYRPILEQELNLLEDRGFGHPEWVHGMRSLLQGELGGRLKTGAAFLLRVGRHSSAEAMTLEGARWIKVSPPGIKPIRNTDDPKKVNLIWLSAHAKNASSNMLPMGWILVEHAPQNELSKLKEWLTQIKPGTNLQARWDEIALMREGLAEKLSQQSALEAQRQAEAAAEQARKEQLDALSPNRKRVEMFIDEFRIKAEQLRGKLDRQYTDYHERARKLAKDALEGADWTAEEKHAAADAIAEWLPKVVERIDKDQLKKLKLAALRGQA